MTFTEVLLHLFWKFLDDDIDVLAQWVIVLETLRYLTNSLKSKHMKH